MERKSYRWCVVPRCGNTSISTPNKLFVSVPRKPDIRKKWFVLARRKCGAMSLTSTAYFCEDHFDLPNDMENYMRYHVMGYLNRIAVKPGCLPSKFHCQTDRKRATSRRASKRHRLALEAPKVDSNTEKEIWIEVSGETSEEQTSSIQIDDSDDNNTEYFDVDEEMCDLEEQIDSLEKQSKNFDKIFEDFGHTVTKCLKSLPLKSALCLQKQLDKVITKFYLHEQQKRSKTLKKGKNRAKNSMNQEAYAPDFNDTNQTETTLIKSNTPYITIIPNTLAESNEDVNSQKLISLPHVKMSGFLVSTIQQEKLEKSISNKRKNSNSKSLQGRSRPSMVMKTRQGGGRISNKPQKRPLFGDPDPEVIESETHTRLEDDDDDVDVVMKLEEEEECLVKTEHDSYDDESNINVKLEQVDECIVKIEHNSDSDDPLALMK